MEEHKTTSLGFQSQQWQNPRAGFESKASGSAPESPNNLPGHPQTQIHQDCSTGNCSKRWIFPKMQQSHRGESSKLPGFMALSPNVKASALQILSVSDFPPLSSDFTAGTSLKCPRIFEKTQILGFKPNFELQKVAVNSRQVLYFVEHLKLH